MTFKLLALSSILTICFASVGCQQATEPKPVVPENVTTETQAPPASVSPEDQAIAEALAELSEEDQQLAKQQKFCVVSNSQRLGSMGTPIKLDVEGEPAFICCKGCEKSAFRNPEQTLKTLASLKAAQN